MISIFLKPGKQQRLTFVECPNDLTAMADVAKVADIALLVIDASFGFEMVFQQLTNIHLQSDWFKLTSPYFPANQRPCTLIGIKTGIDNICPSCVTCCKKLLWLTH